MRRDLHNIHIIWSFPYYITFLPRILICWTLVFTMAFTATVMSIGVKDFKTFSGPRRWFMKLVLQHLSKGIGTALGFQFKHQRATHADYSEYLGPDWKPEWDRPVTLVSNHVSFLDICFIIYWKFPVFVAAVRARNIPGVGAVTDALDTIYFERLGDNAKESRKQVMDKIGNYQRELAAGKAKNSLVIYPEGSTTNGKYLQSFRRGAFNALLEVQPYIWDYQDCGTVPEMTTVDPTTGAFMACCSPPRGVAMHTLLPIFTPNEYFWKHHWEPNKDKEDKVATYTRVVREIFLKYGNFEDANDVICYDRFDAIKAITKTQKITRE